MLSTQIGLGADRIHHGGTAFALITTNVGDNKGLSIRISNRIDQLQRLRQKWVCERDELYERAHHVSEAIEDLDLFIERLRTEHQKHANRGNANRT